MHTLLTHRHTLETVELLEPVYLTLEGESPSEPCTLLWHPLPSQRYKLCKRRHK